MNRLVLLIPLLLVGCTNSQRYPDWEYVRIEEKQAPSENCEYRIQEACSKAGMNCLNWYKKRATVFDANTVVITDLTRATETSSNPLFYDDDGRPYPPKTKEIVHALADYYYCPK